MRSLGADAAEILRLQSQGHHFLDVVSSAITLAGSRNSENGRSSARDTSIHSSQHVQELFNAMYGRAEK